MSPIQSLPIVDLIVFSFVILSMLGAIGFRRKKGSKTSLLKNQSVKDYLVMSRRLTLPLFVMTLVATWYGGIIGVTEITFNYGIYGFITQGFFWYLAYLVFALFVVKRFHQFPASTLPELLGLCFGKNSRKLGAVLNVINLLPIAYCLSIGVILSSLLEIEVWQGVVFGSLFVFLYSMIGGLRSVVFTDTVQFFVMIFAVVSLAIYSYLSFGGFDYLTERLPKSHFIWHGNQSLGSILVWGLIAFGTLVDPNFYHRCFSTNDESTARKGIVWATLIWIVFDLAVLFGALYSRAHLPEADANQAYLLFGLETLPTGLRGLFLAGIVATVLSTLDSFLFLCSSTLTHDLIQPKNPSKLKYVQNMALITVVSIVLSLVSDGKIETIWITLGSISTGVLLVPLMARLFLNAKLKDQEFTFLGVLSLLGMGAWWLFTDQSLPIIYIGIACGISWFLGRAVLNSIQPQIKQ